MLVAMSRGTDEVAVITTFDALEALQEEWNALAAPFAAPMVDHAWIACAARYLHSEGDLRVVVLREAGALTGVAPLVLDRHGGRRLVLPGVRALYEPGGWIFASPAMLGRLISAVGALGETVVLERVPAESALCKSFAPGVGRRAMTVVREQSPSFRVLTNGRTWEAYRATLSHRATSRFRSSWARAEREVGPSSIAHIEPSPTDVDEWLTSFVELEGAGWKGRSRSALTTRPASRAFFADYCRRLAARRELRVTTLTLGGTLAAIELSADAHGRRWALKIAYHENLATSGPAFHLVHASMRATFERGLQAYEFLGVAESWQRRWTPIEQHYRTVAMYRYGAAGLRCAATDLVEFVLSVSGLESRVKPDRPGRGRRSR
jgi:CelD/BcsL family acetyltransferase involved in cellulose biosynthesis